MSHHSLSLVQGPYEAIANGTKTVELRLYDEKRQLVRLGDTITFSKRENPSETIVTAVTGLLRFASFEELLAVVPSSICGYESAAELQDVLGTFYSKADESRYGVIGIALKLL